MKIVLTGGGTGGHLFPLVAVAKKIREKANDTEFIFIGPKGELEKEIMGKDGIKTQGIMVGKMRRYLSFQNIIDIFKIPVGIIQALFWLLVYMPDAIFSKGGYASLPVVLVGWLYRIPVMIHESDANPGLANSILGKFSKRVAVSYPAAEKYFPADQVVLTGNPLRDDINKGSAENARKMFNLVESKKVILVIGGSQGAKSINDKVLNILPDLLHKYQIIHQTGVKNFDEVREVAGRLGIKVGHEGYYPIDFIGEEIKDILAVSDIVITRAGANVLAEVAANAKPAIVIPIENSANDHQRMNAYAIAKAGGCVVLEENNLGEHMLMNKIDEICENEELRNGLSNNIKEFYHANAGEMIADGVLGMIE